MSKFIKNIFIIILLFFQVNSLLGQAQKDNWITDVKEAVDLSLKEKKPMLFLFTGSDWCHWCKVIKKDVFDKDKFLKWAAKEVILVKIDNLKYTKQDPKVRGHNAYFIKMFKVSSFPTVFLIKPEKKNENINLLRLSSNIGYFKGDNEKTWVSRVSPYLKKKLN